mmetsp:Transcript_8672/g.15221  ORF Transcript_8672/g.15221 Transcript_8672/m.15221 type:complete len:311 (-) Transcript_8672:63-995(-)
MKRQGDSPVPATGCKVARLPNGDKAKGKELAASKPTSRSSEVEDDLSRREGDQHEEEEEEVDDEDDDIDVDEEDDTQTAGSGATTTAERRARAAAEDGVCFSKWDKDVGLALSEDNLGVKGRPGFRSVRVNRGVASGKWYCEVLIDECDTSDDPKSVGHVRVGWATALARVDGPVGLDNLSYGYRDIDGSKVHQGVRTSYGAPFQKGDVVGLLIDLGSAPTAPKQGKAALDINAKTVRKGSSIKFQLNGKEFGVAFSDVVEPGPLGYFAMVSVYQNVSARLNPGPKFSNTIPRGFQPLCAAEPPPLAFSV